MQNLSEQNFETKRLTRSAYRKLYEEINHPPIEKRFKRIIRNNDTSSNYEEGISKVHSSRLGSWLESIQENDDETSHENCYLKSQREEQKSFSAENYDGSIICKRSKPGRKPKNFRASIANSKEIEYYSQTLEDSSKEIQDVTAEEWSQTKIQPYSQQWIMENKDSSFDLSYEQINEINTITVSCSNDLNEKLSNNEKINSQQAYKGSLLDDIIEINSSVEKCSIQKQLAMLNTIRNSLSNSESDSEYWEEIIQEEDEWSSLDHETSPDVCQNVEPWEIGLRRSIRIKSKQSQNKKQLNARFYNFRKTCRDKQSGHLKDRIEALDSI